VADIPSAHAALSGLDASFLYLETPSQPLHVCSILDLDTSTMPGGYTFDRLRDELALRIKAMPQFREKLADSPLNLVTRSGWMTTTFDVNRHLPPHRAAATSGRTELAEICVISPVYRWTASGRCGEWVIEGVAGTDAQRVVAGGDDQSASRRCGRCDRGKLDVAAVQHRGGRTCARSRSKAFGGAAISRSR